ncbi:hypothetical protein [Paractinoplanes abujensis]|uniref:hypothetical protein n=1 Tax=Paractinoplanes abujensis TaxID=882441 RepID=UPI00160912BC|nr:hypothetical protein [Actinoplanes abujensis]
MTVAARRWPDDLAGVMREEWLAELAAAGGWRRKLGFAASLAVSPAVDEPSWRERGQGFARAAAVAAGVTLCAALVANVARAAAVFAPLVLFVAAVALVLLGRRVRVSGLLVGAAVFGFLFAGNPVPIMPFMGAVDIAPAVVVWVAGITAVSRWARHLPARYAVGGGLLTLELATVAGSAHAASVLGVPAWSAPAWLPLALLPGDTVAFGPHFPDGSAAFGSLQSSGQAFHASDILLANAAVMTGPLLLCTAFVLASVLRGASGRASTGAASRAAAAQVPTVVIAQAGPVEAPGSAPMPTSGNALTPPGPAVTCQPAARAWRRFTVRAAHVGDDARRIVVGVAAAGAGMAVAPLLSGAPADAEAALPRMLDNTTAFGFGFAEHPAGAGLVALVVAVLAVRAADAHR